MWSTDYVGAGAGGTGGNYGLLSQMQRCTLMEVVKKTGKEIFVKRHGTITSTPQPVDPTVEDKIWGKFKMETGIHFSS
jgi:hypothetical protein